MMKYSSIVLFVFICIGLPKLLTAQVAITAVPFLEINNDARSMGMAGSNVALKGGRSGIHLNPATLGKVGQLEISSQLNINNSESFFGTDWLPSFNISDLYILSPQLIIGFDDFSVGYQYTQLNLGEQYVTSENGTEIIGTFNFYEFAHTLSASFDVNKSISLGMGLNYFKSSLASGTSVGGQLVDSPSTLTIDVGVYAEHPFETNLMKITPSLGWSLTDFGYPIRYTDGGQEDPLPMLMRGGLGLRIDLDEKLFDLQILSMGLYGALEKIMARREDDGTPYGPVKALFRSWDPYEIFDGQETISLSVGDQFRRSLGLELIMLETLSLRWGHFYEHPNNGAREYTTRGIGFHYRFLTIEYAEFVINERNHPLEDTNFFQFTLNLPINLSSILETALE